ncbi:aspartate/glutamate racemase family protein [Stappia stellulata]|uniref:aspartate/glutamate racemase family protein n=1 Tax=Stappia stellulata TaxID=71235 RepID=UPI00040262D1|nr:aspartate/glutamate racemase family protein [Stappia stellulata]
MVSSFDTPRPAVGILMLDTRFPRIPGDIGNARSFDFPVRYAVVPQASPTRVVEERAEGLLEAFVTAGRALVREGVGGITTSCGLLSLFQDELKAALGVPVAASSLMQVPFVDRLLPPGRRCGILTISAPALTGAHLDAAGCARDTPVGGTEGGRVFTRAILDNAAQFDVAAARADNVLGARALVDRHPEVGAIVLECTNMAPYAADIAEATGLPVYSIVSFINWFQAGLAPLRFPVPEG